METKPWYQSKTVWGSVLAVAAALSGPLFGTHLDAGMQGDLADWLASAGAVIGAGLALYGRLTAKHVIA